MTTVMICDDDPIVRAALASYLDRESDLSVVAAVDCAEQALEVLDEHSPDVVLMDIALPGQDGLEATARIREQRPQSSVLVLTTFGTDEHLRAALAAGASGFLLKTTAAAALVAAVRAAASHAGTVITPELAHQMAGEQPADAAGALVDAEAIAQLGLIEREQEVLVLLRQAESNAGIAEKLTLSESTVKTHVSSLMAKLGCSSRLQVALTAFERGLATPPHP
ncbi:DNA-binding NarL/FixJ family response regulator [Brachybacterium muris]|uniref:response regulator transcription factor n=1 Tax=Brachybacterium muris TaxID=219301 RepID=UPI0019593062|nr:response regulator transcription factor [Brachybacterium muris]MBM7501770.1 DNA-binding NarL/FixJ family response regulator [Brachybacterium muris]MCT1431652.1 response regulator transcription factor [Brachybacterium muris]MCT2295958.1 response regulator transcription factor [Brachybacterium muris]